MGKPRSRPPADVARVRRRSLMELTAAVSRTIEEGLIETPPGPVTVSRDDRPRSEQTMRPPAVRTPALKTPCRTTAAQKPIPEAVDESVAMLSSVETSSRPTQFQEFKSTADLIVEVAKDMQACVLDTMKAGVHAALDYTKDIASSESDLLEGPAAECHTMMLELMKVNAGASLHYTRELSRARTLSELIELSSTQARKQCELVLQQSELLRSLLPNGTTPGPE